MTEEYKLSRRDFLKLVGEAVALTGLAGLVAACASMRPKPDFYPEKGWPNTMTYIEPKTKEEKVVYDLSGNWEAMYGGKKEIVEIKQEGNYFEGIKKIGGVDVPQGAKTIRGTIEGNLIDCETYHSRQGWQFGASKNISKDGNSFQCWGTELRTFKRIQK